jgi:hypothetical protein
VMRSGHATSGKMAMLHYRRMLPCTQPLRASA